MLDLTSKIAAILSPYVREPATAIEGSTTLNELEIDELDLQMISLDIEDKFGVQIRYDDEAEALATVQSLVASVEILLDAKAKQPPRSPRVKSNWLSTGSERRR
jgi:acyl carrier protein